MPLAKVGPPLVKVLGALPAPLQLALAGGRPVRVDGQLLEPEAQLVLRLFGLIEKEGLDQRTVEEARQSTRTNAGLVRPRVPRPMADVVHLSLPGGGVDARLYVPPGIPNPSPLLIYFHGGGYVCGDLDTHETPCRFLAAEAALRVLSVDYRLAPEHPFPAPIEDGMAALRYAFDEADSLGADPAAIAVGGDSAGGNLAAVVVQEARDEDLAPAFQLLIYPVADWSRKTLSYRLFREGFFLTEAEMDWYRDHYLGHDPEAASDPRASPLLAESLEGVAPACVAVAGFDPLRDEGIAYARRLEEAGVPTTLKTFSSLVHGFVNATAVGRSAPTAVGELAATLRQALAGA